MGQKTAAVALAGTPSEDPGRTPNDPAAVMRAWERLPRETDREWALFLGYRESAYPEGPNGKYVPRSLRVYAETVGITHHYAANLSSSYSWNPRAGAYDRELDRRKAEVSLSMAERFQARQIRRLEKLGNLCETELDKLLARATLDQEAGVLSPRDLHRLLEFVVKTERLLVDQPSEIVRTEGEWDLEDLPLEDLLRLAEIRKRAQKG